MSRVNRREFLQASGAAITGLTCATLVSAGTAKNKNNKAKSQTPSKKGRVGKFSLRNIDEPTGKICGAFVVAPSTVAVGQKFDINLKMLTDLHEAKINCFTTHYPTVSSSTIMSPRSINRSDGLFFRNNVPDKWTGKLLIESDSAYRGPSELIFKQGQPGPYPHDFRAFRKIESVSFSEPGVHFVTFTEPRTGITQTSNPIYVSNASPRENLYWADIHGHTIMTDGVRSAEEYYYFGRDEGFLDICALSDHTEYYLTDYMWDYFTAVTNGFYKPGKFVTLLGFEWTYNKLGHRNLYFPGNKAPRIRHTDPKYSTLEALYKFARDNGAIAIPHHSASNRMGCDWSLGHDPEVERLVETYSIWGSSERTLPDDHPRLKVFGLSGKDNGRHVVDALNRGYKFGIMAAGDIHDGRPGHSSHRASVGQLGGLMGVWAKDLTRESVFEAMWNRRVYGTSGVRIFLKFSMAGSPMGSTVNRRGTVPVVVETSSGVPIAKIELVRNGVVHQTYEPQSQVVNWEFKEKITSSAYYYVRVTREDAELAWSSPVWVEI